MLLAAMVLAPWGGVPASAASGTETSISITTEQYGPYNQGSLFFDSANAFFRPNSTLNKSHTALDFYVGDGTDFAHVTLTAPKGSTLQPGIYNHAIAGANSAGQPVDGSRPGINVVIGDITCDEEEGSFDLHRLTANSSDLLTSLWVTFRMRCLIPSTQGYVIGDVRYNVPGDGGGVVVGPRDVWWPDEETDAVPLTTPVTVFNPGSDPVQLGTAAVSGPDAADDTIASDGCSGVTLAPGGTCQITLNYKAHAAGDNQATLVVPESGGPQHTVSLHGFVFSGTTQFVLHSDPGDWLGGGKDYDFTPANAQDISAGGSYQGVGVVWNGEGGPGEPPGSWAIGFDEPDGKALVAGKTYDKGISAISPGRGCSTETGSFTIQDILVDQWGDVQRLAATFDIHCDTSKGDLHGTIDYQENAIDVTVTNGAVQISGAVAPNEPGKQVRVELQKKLGKNFVLVHQKGLKLNHASGYRTKFQRAKGKTCRAVAIFKAKRKHLGSRTVKQFHC